MPRRSPVSYLTPRASCAASRSCGSASTTCRCSTRWPTRRSGASGDDALAEADAEYKKLHEDIEAMEVRTLLGGEYDEREALVNIRSGAGGVDAADWAEMLMRMYIRWAEQAQLPRRGVRHLLRRRGGHQERDVRRARPVRLRHVVGGAGHAPAGAHQPVRQPEPAPDVLRRSRSASGGGRPPTTSRSPTATCVSTSTGPAVRAGSR